MNMMNDPRLRTDSYAKIFLYNTHETVACVPRHTIRMKDRVRPDQAARGGRAGAAALSAYDAERRAHRGPDSATARMCVRPVVLPFDGVSARYTIGSADTNGYLFLVGYHEDTIYMEYQHSISDGRGFEEFIRCVLFQYLKNCGCPVENDGTVRAMDTRWTPEESADGYEQLADREFSPEGIWKSRRPSTRLRCSGRRPRARSSARSRSRFRSCTPVQSASASARSRSSRRS